MKLHSGEDLSTVQRVAIVGAGLMGHGIGQEFALAGYDVVLHSRTEDTLERAAKSIKRNLRELKNWGLVSDRDIRGALNRMRTTTALEEAIKDADLVIEAVFEDLEAKRLLFHQMDGICSKYTILGSNTSSFMPSMLASMTNHPERVIVIHYFYPPHLLPLVEIVPGEKTTNAVVDLISQLLKKMGKKPILVRKEVPGFIANRLQVALQREALYLVEKGIATPQDVDIAVKKGFGRRLGVAGPFEMLELQDGWAQALQIHRTIIPDLGSSTTPSSLILKKVEQGRLGAKTGRGFYEWTSEFTEGLRGRLVEVLLGLLKEDCSQVKVGSSYSRPK